MVLDGTLGGGVGSVRGDGLQPAPPFIYCLFKEREATTENRFPNKRNCADRRGSCYPRGKTSFGDRAEAASLTILHSMSGLASRAAS